MIYGMHCYLMIFLFWRRHRQMRQAIAAEVQQFQDNSDRDWPMVTIQLPIYNEFQVVQRLLNSAAELDYPRDRYEIQVLDDSQDETSILIDNTIEQLREHGVAIYVLRRQNREGFKAGALAAGMPKIPGEFLAIFDADFVVPKNFLKRIIPLIAPHPDVACVQARWEHLNRSENWLTHAQSVGIDGHFAAEQGARSYNGFCLNFNGTAGIWRKQAIIAGGGWHSDTLTEDLDLSYRVQMAGYKLRYDFDLECPAEIPNNILALKNQQRRWAKGSIETAKKLIPLLYHNNRLSRGQKLEACLHLTHYMVSLLMALLCLLSLPVLLLTPVPEMGWFMGIILLLIVASAMAPCVMYTGSGFILRRGCYSFSRFPSMLVMGTGLCLNNALAVCQGFFCGKSEFVRTPKSGSTSQVKQTSKYRVSSILFLGIMELLLGGYCFITFWVYLHAAKYIFGFFIGIYALGLTIFGSATLKYHLTPPQPKLSPSSVQEASLSANSDQPLAETTLP